MSHCSDKAYFHGHSGVVKIKKLHRPSPSRPFFVAANIRYSLQMASLDFDPTREKYTSTQMRRKSQEDLKNAQILKIKLSEDLKEFDLRRDARKLDEAYNNEFSKMLEMISTGNGKHRPKMVNFDIIANISKAMYEDLKCDLHNSGVDTSFQNIMHLIDSGELAEGTYLAFYDEDDFEEYAESRMNSILLSYGLVGYTTFMKYMIAFIKRHGNPDDVDCRECLFEDIVKYTGCNAIRYIDSIQSQDNDTINSEALMLFDISTIESIKILSYAEAMQFFQNSK